MASFLHTFTPVSTLPQVQPSAQVRPSSCCPVCSATLPGTSGINGANRMVLMRMHSIRLYSTVPRSAFLFSSFASTQGAVSSIYLFARLIKRQMLASAFGKSIFSKYAAASTPTVSASAFSSASNSLAGVAAGAGTMPSKYLSIIATERLTRLP